MVFNNVSTNEVIPEQAALVQGNDGVIYGTSVFGGLGSGTVFKFVHGTVTVLHNFTGTSDGAESGRPGTGYGRKPLWPDDVRERHNFPRESKRIIL